MATKLAIVTGDHGRPDETKRGGHYNAEDKVAHATMVEAVRSFDDFEVSVWTDHDRFLASLPKDPPDLVVNFCDTGLYNVPTQELHLPAYLEMRGIPYTGAPPAAMVLAYDKAIVRLLAQAQGVAVPAEVFIGADTAMAPPEGPYPALIKPNTADGSVGITKDAVVRDRGEAAAYLRWLRARLPGRDALFQEYLPGPEYGLGLIGNPDGNLKALPALEVDFSALPAELNPILSYESKALPDSPYWTDVTFKRATLPPETETRMAHAARLLFRRLGLRDYGRFDFRTGADGTVKLIEVNPNPAWADDGKLAFMAGFAGIAYRDMLRLIVEAALLRLAATKGRSAAAV